MKNKCKFLIFDNHEWELAKNFTQQATFTSIFWKGEREQTINLAQGFMCKKCGKRMIKMTDNDQVIKMINDAHIKWIHDWRDNASNA